MRGRLTSLSKQTDRGVAKGEVLSVTLFQFLRTEMKGNKETEKVTKQAIDMPGTTTTKPLAVI